MSNRTVIAPHRAGVELKARIVAWSRTIGIDPRLSLMNTTFHESRDFVADRWTVELRRLLKAGDFAERVQVVEYPADWWQAVKKRWFPIWALARWPVVLTRIEVPTKIVRVCPHVEIPEYSGQHVQWLNGED